MTTINMLWLKYPKLYGCVRGWVVVSPSACKVNAGI